MTNRMQNQSAFVSVIVRIFAVAVLMLGLSACSHHPPREDCCTTGDRFIGVGTVQAVYHAPGEKDESPPINKGDKFKIARDAENSSIFKFVPGEPFTGDSAWKDLRLEYQPGIAANEPIPLIAEICTSGQISRPTETAETTTAYDHKQDDDKQNDFVRANVQYDFLNLNGRGLEFLEGSITFNDTDIDVEHTIHIFRFKKIGSKKRSLMIFYCETDRCNHNGGAHADYD